MKLEDKDKRDRLLKHAGKSQDRSRLEAMIWAARSEADIATGVPFCATLAQDNVARNDNLSAKLFDAEAFAAGIAAVFDRSLSFLVSHIEGGWGKWFRR